MLYEDKQQVEKNHSLNLEKRNKLTISGATDVECFDENEIIIHTTQGVLIVSGAGIHMEKLNTDSGDVVVFGKINALKYEDTKPMRDGWMRKLIGR